MKYLSVTESSGKLQITLAERVGARKEQRLKAYLMGLWAALKSCPADVTTRCARARHRQRGAVLFNLVQWPDLQR